MSLLPSAAEGAEHWPVERIRQWQLESLRATLAYAYQRVPLYQRKFDAIGIRPEDLRTLADLEHFPYTSKKDLRQEYPFGMFAVPQDQICRVHASSGTTGKPTVVGYTRGDLQNWAELVARSLRASGARPGDKIHIAYGYGLFTGGLGAHYGAEALGATVIPMSGGQTERQIQLIQDFQPEVIMCTPTYLLTLMDAMQHQGLDPRRTSLRYAICGAEPWTEEMQAELEAGLDLKACDIYGLSEVMGPGVGGEFAQTQDGFHLWEDHFLPEIVDPYAPEAPGAVLPDGQNGELVLTTLSKEALPLIRYRTKDLTRLLPGTARPGMRRMARINGRTDDMIIVRGVNLFPSQVEELVLRNQVLSPHFQLELNRPADSRMDQLTVRVESRGSTTPEQDESAAALLAEQIKTHIGSTAVVAVVPPESLARSNGKLRRVYNLRTEEGST
ncbi:AMP-binding protein [Acaricomes phytoseiuli]|uniref:AMP-binding protein n=1 Tax=Acaricomes phytoseiuli TaxID=291968 RepID=UPI002223E78B|nr:AMP-binding protein [Acaricomes phytoseiuli]MCW1250514.1 AMP-binding protein [Acaricomes phytoseiuli]